MIPHRVKEYTSDFPGVKAELDEKEIVRELKKYFTAAQKKRLEAIIDREDFIVQWIHDWTPSAKVLVGAV